MVWIGCTACMAGVIMVHVAGEMYSYELVCRSVKSPATSKVAIGLLASYKPDRFFQNSYPPGYLILGDIAF